MTRRLTTYLALLLCLLVSVPAAAQLQAVNAGPAFIDCAKDPAPCAGIRFFDDGFRVADFIRDMDATLQAQPRGRAYAPNRLDVVKSVAEQCPGLVLQDHAFTDAVVMELRRRYPSENWGRNGKRGNANDPSHDAIFYPTSSSPFGGAVIDMISCAGGGPNCSPAPAWIDQTDPTIAAGTTGVWVPPSGRLPACLSDGDGGVDPVRPPPVVTPPPATTDLTPVLTALARLQADVDELKNRPQPDPAPPDLGMVYEYIDDMVGNGPGVGENHITDLKQRLDVVRVLLEQLNAWLRGRTVLRY